MEGPCPRNGPSQGITRSASLRTGPTRAKTTLANGSRSSTSSTVPWWRFAVAPERAAAAPTSSVTPSAPAAADPPPDRSPPLQRRQPLLTRKPSCALRRSSSGTSTAARCPECSPTSGSRLSVTPCGHQQRRRSRGLRGHRTPSGDQERLPTQYVCGPRPEPTPSASRVPATATGRAATTGTTRSLRRSESAERPGPTVPPQCYPASIRS